ncbi:MAG: hypothetical protein ACO3AW_04800 [Chitinophagaceae bacterium]
MENVFDLSVAWRIYPKVSKTPIFFSNDKYKIVELSLQSFINSTNGLKIKYYFILDGCPEKYRELIKNLFKDFNYEILETNSVGNLKTFELQLDILSNQNFSEIVYFAEDDYLYQPHIFYKSLNFIKSKNKVDFLTCYHHKETTYHLIHHIKRKKVTSDEINWQTDASTCLTFMTKKSVLNETKRIFLTYTKGNNDCSIWLTLTKFHIYNPLKYFQFWKNNNNGYDILKMSVKYGFKYFFTRKYLLWTSVPGICTHLEKGHESPYVDWNEVYHNIQNRNNEYN